MSTPSGSSVVALWSMSEFLDELRHAVLPIVAIHEDASWTPFGTCFVVAVVQPKRALAFTAAHNLEHLAALDRRALGHHPTTPREFLGDDDHSIELSRTKPKVIVATGPDQGAVGGIVRGWWGPRSDTAALLLDIPDVFNVEFKPRLALDTRPVSEGEQLIAFGYRDMAAPFSSEPDYEKQDFNIRFSFDFRSHPGKVLEVCHEGAGMYRWPGFLVDAPLDSGMSGGPVVSIVDNVLRVRGIVCGDVSENADNGAAGSGRRAFASALWPLMGLRTNVQLLGLDDSVQVPPHAPLLEWARQGTLDDRGAIHEHLRIVSKGDGTDDFTYEW
jgi:hypothetical protein